MLFFFPQNCLSKERPYISGGTFTCGLTQLPPQGIILRMLVMEGITQFVKHS